METPTQQQVDEIKQLIFRDPAITSDIQALLNYLPASEYELILFMISEGVWDGPAPLPPPNFTPGEGTVDLGLCLYWLNNPAHWTSANFLLTSSGRYIY